MQNSVDSCYFLPLRSYHSRHLPSDSLNHVLNFVRDTKFHIDTKQQVNLCIIYNIFSPYIYF
jgi:hypothetical protein